MEIAASPGYGLAEYNTEPLNVVSVLTLRADLEPAQAGLFDAADA